ncbi:PCI domain-containing protein 2-like isoform X2 [Gordionus sp. m RMFG-2023]
MLLSLTHQENFIYIDDQTIYECEYLGEPYKEIIPLYIKCVKSLKNLDFLQAFDYQTNLIQFFIKYLQNKNDENWMLPIMYQICLDLRKLASKIEAESIKSGAPKHGLYLEKASDTLLGCFRVCATDNFSSAQYSKKWGMLYLVNQLFKIYFKINRLPLCKPLIRAVENSKSLENYPLSQIVTYKFYVGRKAFYDLDYEKANVFLSFSFQHCNKYITKNIRLILIYLIPVKILLGYNPSHGVLSKYDLLPFEPIIQSIKDGNLGMLERSKEANKKFFIQSGIYLFMDKLKIVCIRNLFKKVFLILGSFQIDITSFLTALNFAGYEEADCDLDEIECLLANLIYEGKIKGYISHQHKKLVVSKLNAFPKLTK